MISTISTLRVSWRHLNSRLQRSLIPPSLKVLAREFGNAPFSLLDVGSGNHGATGTTFWLPECAYYGIDITRDYNNDQADFDRMQEFWEMDLEDLAFDAIPNDFFDAVVMSHVIEHLDKGVEVLIGLVPKLRAGGIVYVETPSERSLRLPSMRGSLNFHDDATHRRLYSVPEMAHALETAGCRIVRTGFRRDPVRAMVTPISAGARVVKTRHLQGSDFWDLLGFAHYVLARKK